jgi:hypothetical protein
VVRYLVRVLAPDSALVKLSDGGPLWIRQEARLTRAIGLAARADWARGAALLQPVDSARATLWTEAARLARESSFAGRVELARFLRRHQGRLMFRHDGDWYRSVEWRIPRGDSTPALRALSRNLLVPDEPARIARHLLQSTESYLALGVYADALSMAQPGSPGLQAIVKEADLVYRSLIDWNHGTTRFWSDRLVRSREASIIRRVGRAAP